MNHSERGYSEHSQTVGAFHSCHGSSLGWEMLKHHPHSTSLSVAAVSYWPIQSLTLYSTRQQRSGICTDRNMVLQFLWGQTCPWFCGLGELFLAFDKEPRERMWRQKERTHAKPPSTGPWCRPCKGCCGERGPSEAAGSAAAHAGLQRAIEGSAKGGRRTGKEQGVVFALALSVWEVKEGQNLLHYNPINEPAHGG